MKKILLFAMLLTAFACGKEEVVPELGPLEKPLSETEQLIVGEWCWHYNGLIDSMGVNIGGSFAEFYEDRTYENNDFLWYIDESDSLHFVDRPEKPWHITVTEDSLRVVFFSTLNGVWAETMSTRCD